MFAVMGLNFLPLGKFNLFSLYFVVVLDMMLNCTNAASHVPLWGDARPTAYNCGCANKGIWSKILLQIFSQRTTFVGLHEIPATVEAILELPSAALWGAPFGDDGGGGDGGGGDGGWW